MALSLLVKFFNEVGERRLSRDFLTLVEALHDLSVGTPNPLLKFAAKGGRPYDTKTKWRLRADVCVGFELMIAGGIHLEKALAAAARKYGKSLVKLQRSGADELEDSLR